MSGGDVEEEDQVDLIRGFEPRILVKKVVLAKLATFSHSASTFFNTNLAWILIVG